MKIGERLIANRAIGREDLERALEVQRQAGGFFFILQGVGLGFSMIDGAAQHFSLAGAAGAIPAAIG